MMQLPDMLPACIPRYCNFSTAPFQTPIALGKALLGCAYVVRVIFADLQRQNRVTK